MPTINLNAIEIHQNEPKMYKGKGFLSVPSVGMRLAPEVLVLELFREVFYSTDRAEHLQTRELQPDLRDADNALVFSPAERAVIYCLQGRRKDKKQSRGGVFFAPAYPVLARDAWLHKKRERVILRLLFEGAFAQSFWCRGDGTVEGTRQQERAVDTMLRAFVGTLKTVGNESGIQDVLAAPLPVTTCPAELETARQALMRFTQPSDAVFQADGDELATRIASDFLAMCEIEATIPRMLWLRLLMTYIRFVLPVWLLAQMQITTLVYRWLLNAMSSGNLPSDADIFAALARRNRNLITPTLTPTRELFGRISDYMRCRIELNVLLFCLDQLSPGILGDRIITTRKVGAGVIRLSELLSIAANSAASLRADPAFGSAPSVAAFLGRAAERFHGWRDPRNKGQGKNIDEFLRVLYRAERGDEAGGHLLVREGRGDGTGFRVFPGQLLLQVVAFLAARAKQTSGRHPAGGGRLVLQDIEDHFGVYGVDFALAADARPLLIAELQGLGLLNGSPDAGSSVGVTCPY